MAYNINSGGSSNGPDVNYRGQYNTLADLQAAFPVGQPGWFATLVHGNGDDVTEARWDTDDNQWVDTGESTKLNTAAIATLQGSSANLQSQIDSNDTDIAALVAQYGDHDSEIVALQIANGNLQSQITDNDNEIAAIIAAASDDQQISLNGTVVELEDGGSIDLSSITTKLTDAQLDKLNSLQNMDPEASTMIPNNWFEVPKGTAPSAYPEGWQTLNGNANENCITEMNDTPSGDPAFVWVGTADPVGGSDGGFRAKMVEIDPTKDYRLSMWVRRPNAANRTDGSIYTGIEASFSDARPSWGSAPGTIVNQDNGGANNNPYSWAGDLPEADEWFLLVHHVRAFGSTNSGPLPETGAYKYGSVQKAFNLFRDFRFAADTVTHLALRTFQFYSALGDTESHFMLPKYEIVDGSETPLEVLLGVNPDKSKKVYVQQDSRSGCPAAFPANTDINLQTVTLEHRSVVEYEVQTIGNRNGRFDTYIMVDGVNKQGNGSSRHLTSANNASWKPVNLKWRGILDPGVHTFAFRCTTANTIGCGTTWGVGAVTVVPV